MFSIPAINPYAPPQQTHALPEEPFFHRGLSLVLLCAVAVIVGWPGTLSPLQFPIPDKRIMYFAPPLYWDLFCRRTPRPYSNAIFFFHIIARCIAVYMFSQLTYHFAICLVILSLPDTITWTIQPSCVFGAAIICAGFTFARYDYWVARRRGLKKSPAAVAAKE